MNRLAHKFESFGATLETLAVSKNLDGYKKIDSLITEINRLIFRRRGNEKIWEILNDGFTETFATFRERYKDLLKSFGIHICSTKGIYRKKKWFGKSRSKFGNNKAIGDYANRKKVYCEDCGHHHFV